MVGRKYLTVRFLRANAARNPVRPFCLLVVLMIAFMQVPLAGWGQSEWKWLTGGNLKAVKFVGQKGWIIGDDGNQGIILHTTDGGDTWAIQPHNTGRHYFNGMSFVDSLNGWIVGGMRSPFEQGFILRTRDGGKTWIEEFTAPDSYYLFGVCYVDTIHGWFASTVDTIFRTTNGGITWQGFQPDPRRYVYHTIDFIDSLRGWAVGPGIFMIAKTTDGGLTWAIVSDAFVREQNGIDMDDSLNGWTGGGSGVTVRTRDGWRTWQSSSSGSIAILYGISFTDTMNGWAVGGFNGLPATVSHTTNGGVTWTADTTLTKNDVFYGVDATSVGTAFIAGSGGSIAKTTNSGNNWIVSRNVDIGTRSLNNAFFKSVNQGWAVGTYGVITHTSNGGAVWQLQNSGTTAFLYGVDFPDPLSGWVCGSNGIIMGTTDAGTTWTRQASNPSYYLFSIEFLPGDTVFGWAVGGYYGPLDSLKGHGREGETALQNAKCKVQSAKWKSNDEIASSYRYGTPRNDALPIWGADPTPGPSPKALGEGRYDFWKWPWRPEETPLQTPYRIITRTTNGGALWTAVNSTGQVPLYGVSFVSRAEGWACGDPQGGMGVILHTTDSGATWQGQSSNVNQGLFWIQFRDRFHGWTVGNAGTALWTTDGGSTWNQGNTGTTLQFLSCAFYDTLGGFACGGNGTLFQTTDGGRNWQADSSKTHANLMAICALDSSHAWTVGSYGMVLGREAGTSGVETTPEVRSQRLEVRLKAQPNPFVSYARVPGREKDKFVLYDITGRRVGTYKGDRIGADATAGVYFLMAEDKESKPVRIVKIR